MKTYHIGKQQLVVFILLLNLIFQSCKKQNDWLDVKNNKSAVIPESLQDFQAMLANTTIINNQYSTAGLVSTDNFSITDATFNASAEDARNLYIWNKTVWPGPYSGHWEAYFKIIESANVVLEGLTRINGVGYDYNNVKGQALFHRAMSYYSLAQLFCKTYSTTASTDLGLPIRLGSDVNVISPRSTLSQTYQQILKDSQESSLLLPDNQPFVQRPIRAAAFALIAKTYLHMGDYSSALQAATKSLELKSQLLDFNDNTIVNANSTYRFPAYAKNISEVLFYAESYQFAQVAAVTSNTGIVANDLYQAYDGNDLRKTIFYILSGTNPKFRGSYTGRVANFSGLATNEVYLIRAECFARGGNAEAAMNDLNLLLKNRFKTNSYTNQSALNAADALQKVLTERRKELPFTSNIRWEDLRRLNKEAQFQKSLMRIVNGVTYTLIPNDRRYVLPISAKEIQLSGIAQNER